METMLALALVGSIVVTYLIGLAATSKAAMTADEVSTAESLARSHLLAVPSSYEGFGIVYLEGMAFGLPALASSAGGAQEIIRHGETGWLVPPGEPVGLARAILEALADPAQGRRMGTWGRAIVEAEYSLERMGERMERLYTKLASARRGKFLGGGGGNRRHWETETR